MPTPQHAPTSTVPTMSSSPFDLATPPALRRAPVWPRAGAALRLTLCLGLAFAAGLVELLALWRARRRGPRG